MEHLERRLFRFATGVPAIILVAAISYAVCVEPGLAVEREKSLSPTKPSGISPPASPPAAVSAKPSLKILAEGDLREKPRPLKVEPGAGFTITIAKGDFISDMVVSDRGRPVKELEGVFSSYVLVNFGQNDYLIIPVFSGGAHCCSSYAVFVKPRAGGPARYVGETAGEEGGAESGVKESLVERNGQLYLQVGFPGFSYFHTSFAGSLLVNVPQIYYHITPNGLTINNAPFKDLYLKEGTNTESEIIQELAKRRVKPLAILNPTGPGSEVLGAIFSDDLAQLLVKRTIFYLKAGETKTAWDSFSRDVAKYYQSTRWMKEVFREVQETLNPKPASRPGSPKSRSIRRSP